MLLFQPDGISYVNKEKETVLEAARNAGVRLENPCGGNGTCGKCRIKVLIGEGNPVTEEEKKILSSRELLEGWRLACKFVPKYFKACEIEVPSWANNEASYRVELMDKYNEEGLGEVSNGSTNIEGHYGVAIDIGTTNIEALLWRLDQEKCVGRVIGANPQKKYGADVVARIAYAQQSKGQSEEMCQVLLEGIKQMLLELLSQCLVQKEKVCCVTVDGNAAMMHFFAGESVESLARAPYKTTYREGRVLSGSILSLPFAKVVTLPNVEGFVGADTVGVLRAIRENGQDMEGMLMIDIGTNGELALQKDGVMYVASTAAGPAFEGATISCGMRAENGAVTDLILGDRVFFQVIQKKERVLVDIEACEQNRQLPTIKGICGSGLIAVAARLLEAGLIDKTGYLLDSNTAKERGCSKVLTERIETREEGNVFRMEEHVYLTQQDIRELQLAKAAIGAGVKMLLKSCGMREEELLGIYLAGAFGSYLDVTAAQQIGLLPAISKEKIKAVGNGALQGASCALQHIYQQGESGAEMKYLEKIARDTTHISLAEQDEFSSIYLEAVNFI